MVSALGCVNQARSRQDYALLSFLKAMLASQHHLSAATHLHPRRKQPTGSAACRSGAPRPRAGPCTGSGACAGYPRCHPLPRRWTAEAWWRPQQAAPPPLPDPARCNPPLHVSPPRMIDICRKLHCDACCHLWSALFMQHHARRSWLAGPAPRCWRSRLQCCRARRTWTAAPAGRPGLKTRFRVFRVWLGF